MVINKNINARLFMKKFTHMVVIFLFSVLLPACGGTYTGRVAVKGHEPFTYLALVMDRGDMKIVGGMKQKLWDCCQGKLVTVKGAIVKEGGGFMAPPELEVTEIVDTGR
jgi:hypothetical protein